jgi:membrane fusion protein, multidrug efflux system
MIKQPKFYNHLFIVSAVLILLACNAKKSESPQQSGPMKPPPLTVDLLIAKNETLSADIEVPGTILANEATEIHAEISGRLVQLNIKEGSFVSQGTLLAKLYDGDLQAQKRKLEVQLKIAEQTENRQEQLLKIQGISQQEYDISLLQVHNLNADIDIIKEAIRKTEIRAPFSGRLGLKNVSPGAYVTPAMILSSISQVNQLKIQFNVPEKYGAQLKNNQQVSFKTDGSDKTFTAQVLATEIEIDENTRTLAVRALIRNAEASLIPGSFAKVRIVMGKNDQAIMIPTSIILPQGRNKLVYLYKDGISVQTTIKTGVRDSTMIEVVSGLNVGDSVIKSGLLYLKPGGEVTLAKPKT